MSLGIYVAGAQREPERVRAAMTAAQGAGLVLTLDWLAEIEAQPAPEGVLEQHDRRRFAHADLDAIDRADVVWLLASVHAKGAWVELGYALRGQKTIVVSGPDARRSIFCALAIEIEDDAKVIPYLRHLAEVRGRR